MEFTGDYYAQTKEDFIKACNEAKAQGYKPSYKYGKDRYVYFHLSDERYERRAKCDFCGHNNIVDGCKAHNKQCDNCGEIIHYALLPGDLVKFVFREDEQSRQITLRVHEYNYYSSLIRFEKAIPAQRAYGRKTPRKEVLAVLEEFKHCYNVVKDKNGKEYYSFYYPRMLNDFAKINTYETRGKDGYGAGKTHNKIVQIIDGKEYGEHDCYNGAFNSNLPVPISFHIYKDYKIEKTMSEICSRCNVNYRPEYYSGRGVNRGDIGSKHLVKIHNEIKRFHGDDAAAEFTKVVLGAEDMSATALIKRMKFYEKAGFKWDKEWDKDQSAADGIALDHDSPVQMMVSIAGVMMGSSGTGRSMFGEMFAANEAESIKHEFMSQIKE